MKYIKLTLAGILTSVALLLEIPAIAAEMPQPCQNPAHHYLRDSVKLYYPVSFIWTDQNFDGWIPWENHRNEQDEPIAMLPENGCYFPMVG